MSGSEELNLVGRALLHYRINAAIGAGGMGEVYRATDTKLGREVALKVLPQNVASDPERLARFQREARAVAALNHPNIVTLYSVEEGDGIHFLTMELIEGQPLDRLIPSSGLPVEHIVAIGSALAEALAAAHEKGIMHRDLKPANVMVTDDGRIKVLDFGLAKEAHAADVEGATLTGGLTAVGMVMGTPFYMSPEQVSGRVLDHRSDIFSLGVMLHEMATGWRPFEGKSSAELTSAILRDSPPLVTDVRAELPVDLARIIRRCLEKDPRHRVQTARDVANEFRDITRSASRSVPTPASTQRATPVPGSGAARSDQGFWVAVLPFKHAGADPELDSFAEGLAEDITAGLAKFPYLSVISRNSTLRFKDQTTDVRAVGQQLGARYVLEGGIRKSASAMRINMQLSDTQTGAHLWAETYNRDLKNSEIFSLQDDLTDRVVATVGDSYGALVRSMVARVEERPEEELTASDWVLRHFRYRQFITPEEHARVRDGLEQFVKREPRHASVWACLAQMYVHEFALGYNQRPEALERALAAARRCLHLDLTNQHGRYILAFVYFFRRDIPAFRVTAEQAMEMNPRDTDTLGAMGLLLLYTGDFERGASLVRRAMDLNPHHADWMHFALMWEYFQKGDYENALAQVTRMSMPGLYWQPLSVAACCGLLGRKAEAAIAVQELLKLDKDFERHGQEDIDRWLHSSGLMDRYLEGLSKAGLHFSAPGEPAAGQRPAGGSAAESGSEAATSTPKDASGAVRAAEGFWVAVLPFKYRGTDSSLEGLAEGLTDEIITGLSRFSYLRVIARGSTAKYSIESGDVRSIGKELGARYVMVGNLRGAGGRVRVTVQLSDTTTGAQLWTETYERAFSSQSAFDIQDDLVPRIVSTVADVYGVLPHSMSQAVRNKPAAELTPYEGLLCSFSYAERVTAEEHNRAKTALEHAVQQVPGLSDCWAMLSIILTDGYIHGFDSQPSTLDRALEAARCAVDADSSNHKAHQALAWVQFFRKDFKASRIAAERTITLNPMDASATVYVGQTIAFAGDWERGCGLVTRAIQLNPNHPGWYWYALFLDAYRKNDFSRALELALKIDMPGFPLASVAVAAACGQLGERERAQTVLRELLSLRPDYPAAARKELEKIWDPQLVEHLIGGLRKAGLEISLQKADGALSRSSASAATVKPLSGEARAEEGFWVAVLPFKYTGANPDLKALAEGLSEEVITGLSRFSYLRVIARGSMAKYLSESGDVRAIGKELGARYVMEGSLRQAGSRLRLAVQLVDTASGAHLWAETYERAFQPEAVFDLQDDLVPRIVSTVADQDGILPLSMAEALHHESADQLTPHEAMARSFSFFKRLTPEEHAKVRQILEIAVRKSPDHGDCWAMLSHLYSNEYWGGFNAQPDPLDRALNAARRAVDAAPYNHLSYWALALALYLRRDLAEFRTAAERAIELNPMDGSSVAFMGALIAYSGDWERGCAIAEPASALNPNHAGWHKVLPFYNAFREGEYREALTAALRLNAPGSPSFVAARAAAYGQLGEREAAQKAVKELLALDPAFATTGREFYAKFLPAQLVERLMDGLRKAGVDVPGEAEITPRAN